MLTQRLFPYETEDKITAHSELTGSKTILRVLRNGRSHLWEPFSNRYADLYRCERHLYKNIIGNKLVFEEINHDLQLTLRTAWRTSDRFGFIKSSWLQNDGDKTCQIDLLDGLQNLLPYGATTVLQTTMSSLLHAYKRNELEPETGLGIFALSATLTDRAEPSESLQATVAWQVGLDNACVTCFAQSRWMDFDTAVPSPRTRHLWQSWRLSRLVYVCLTARTAKTVAYRCRCESRQRRCK